MGEILTKAGCFVAIILLGWFLRRIDFFKEGDFQILAKIVLRITLPAAIVYSYAGKEIDVSMLLISLLGLCLGLGYIAVGYLLGARGGKDGQSFTMLNISGYNIGNFTMPFAQGFLGGTGVITTSLFDTGNAFICLGVAYSLSAMVRNGQRFSLIKVIKDLSRSVPFVTYIIMATLALLHIGLPQPVTDFAGILGNANAPMAMLMLGVGFHISGDRGQKGAIVKILTVRYLIAIAVSCACFFWMPFDLETRKALAVLAFSPIASAAPAFTQEMGADAGLSSAINSISIVISLICIVTVLLLVL